MRRETLPHYESSNTSQHLRHTMLDSFEILTTSGVVLWSKSYNNVSPSIINSFIKDVFIEDTIATAAGASSDTISARNPTYKKDKYTLKWTTAKDLGLIFVVSDSHLGWHHRGEAEILSGCISVIDTSFLDRQTGGQCEDALYQSISRTVHNTFDE